MFYLTFRTLISAGLASIPAAAMGCGLDWTLPISHYNGVEEHGYVAYWEKIGEADLGNRLVIPINIGFNSHREASSPTLGKGWIVPLLESHVEPIDENSMNVIMPDGWTFLFYRNANTETWRGNAGWVGETNNTIFTIAAPCGWKIKFDQGKIQEISSGNNRTLTYRYNGGVATEVDDGSRAIVQVESNLATGVPSDLLVDGQKIELSQARRPQIVTKLNENLIVAFDQSLSGLQWPDGKKESFAFSSDPDLNPTLAITEGNEPQYNFAWDPTTRQIKTDGTWTYHLQPSGDHWKFERVASDDRSESYDEDEVRGITKEKGADGNELTTYRFPSGPLAGRIRKVEEVVNGRGKILYSATYFPSGYLMREIFYPDKVRTYSENGKFLKETVAGNVDYEQDFDGQGRLVHILNPSRQVEVKRTYDSQGGEITQVFKDGALFYTEQIDPNNKLISLNEGGTP